MYSEIRDVSNLQFVMVYNHSKHVSVHNMGNYCDKVEGNMEGWWVVIIKMKEKEGIGVLRDCVVDNLQLWIIHNNYILINNNDAEFQVHEIAACKQAAIYLDVDFHVVFKKERDDCWCSDDIDLNMLWYMPLSEHRGYNIPKVRPVCKLDGTGKMQSF